MLRNTLSSSGSARISESERDWLTDTLNQQPFGHEPTFLNIRPQLSPWRWGRFLGRMPVDPKALRTHSHLSVTLTYWLVFGKTRNTKKSHMDIRTVTLQTVSPRCKTRLCAQSGRGGRKESKPRQREMEKIDIVKRASTTSSGITDDHQMLGRQAPGYSLLKTLQRNCS